MKKLSNYQKEELKKFALKESSQILHELLKVIKEKSVAGELTIKDSETGNTETWILWFQSKKDYDAAIEKQTNK